MLNIKDIHTYYDNSHVLQGVSLTVKKGEVVTLLGRNGVGKSTTINSIIGFTPPRQGQIILNGVDITSHPSHQTARLGVGLVPQGRGIFPTLTVRENVTLAARNGAKGGWTLESILELFPALSNRLKNRGDQLSGGEQQMLALARALMTNPRLLLLDEPSEGLAPLIVVEIGRVISQLQKEGISILVVEQNLSLALGVADQVYVMNKGQIVFEGTPASLQAQKEIMHQYLGV
ncbi:MAG: ABC transporter ATP-binding protein [Chloroflexi bacterium]|nr:ABC transporter ATP-binding protein [Chloroflexota bacterium]